VSALYWPGLLERYTYSYCITTVGANQHELFCVQVIDVHVYVPGGHIDLSDKV
jgi:hypothetical protein